MVGPGFLDLPSRTVKPRGTGITHVLDRGLPLGYCADLLESGGAYVDEMAKQGGRWLFRYRKIDRFIA